MFSMSFAHNGDQFSKAFLVGVVDHELSGIGAGVHPNRHCFAAENQFRPAFAKPSPSAPCIVCGSACWRAVPAFHWLCGPPVPDPSSVDQAIDDGLCQRRCCSCEDRIVRGQVQSQCSNVFAESGDGFEGTDLRVWARFTHRPSLPRHRKAATERSSPDNCAGCGNTAVSRDAPFLPAMARAFSPYSDSLTMPATNLSLLVWCPADNGHSAVSGSIVPMSGNTGTQVHECPHTRWILPPLWRQIMAPIGLQHATTRPGRLLGSSDRVEFPRGYHAHVLGAFECARVGTSLLAERTLQLSY